MASKNQPGINNVRSMALASKTDLLRESWQRQRRARLLEQLAMNAEIKQRWVETHYAEPLQARVGTGGNAASNQTQPRDDPFRAVLTAGKTTANKALAYIVSVFGLPRMLSRQASRSHG